MYECLFIRIIICGIPQRRAEQMEIVVEKNAEFTLPFKEVSHGYFLDVDIFCVIDCIMDEKSYAERIV